METEKREEAELSNIKREAPEMSSDVRNETEKDEAKRIAQMIKEEDKVMEDSALAAADLKRKYISDSTTAETKKAIENIAGKVERKEITFEEGEEEAKKTQKGWLRRTTDLLHITDPETGNITTGAKVVGIGGAIVGGFFALKSIWRNIFGEDEKQVEGQQEGTTPTSTPSETAPISPTPEAPAPTTAPAGTNAPAPSPTPAPNAPASTNNNLSIPVQQPGSMNTPSNVPANTGEEQHPLDEATESAKKVGGFVESVKELWGKIFG